MRVSRSSSACPHRTSTPSFQSTSRKSQTCALKTDRPAFFRASHKSEFRSGIAKRQERTATCFSLTTSRSLPHSSRVSVNYFFVSRRCFVDQSQQQPQQPQQNSPSTLPKDEQLKTEHVDFWKDQWTINQQVRQASDLNIRVVRQRKRENAIRKPRSSHPDIKRFRPKTEDEKDSWREQSALRRKTHEQRLQKQNTLNNLLLHYFDSDDHQGAESLFQQDNPDMPKDIVSYNIYISRMLKHKPAAALRAFNKVTERGDIRPESQTYIPVINYYFANNEAKKATELISDMLLRGIPMGPVAIINIILGLLQNNMTEEAKLWREQFLKHNYNINMCHIPEVKAFISSSQQSEDQQQHQQDIRKRLTTNKEIEKKLEEGKVDDALTLYSKLRDGDEDIKPDALTFGMLIKGLLKNSRLDQCFLEIRDPKNRPYLSSAAMTQIIVAVSQKELVPYTDKVLGMNEVFELARDTGLLNTILMNAFISIYAKNSDWKEVDRMRGAMKEESVSSNATTFVPWLSALFSAGMHDKVDEVMKEMMEELEGQPTDFYLLTTLIIGYRKRGTIKSTPQILKLLEQNGIISMNINLYNKLITNLIKHQKINEAREVKNMMIQAGIKPNLNTPLLPESFTPPRHNPTSFRRS